VERSSEGEDSEERRYVGPGTFEVPDAHVEAYLDRGWERPDPETATAAVEQPEPEEAAEAKTEADADGDDGFDAAGFVDESWQAVKAAIEDGEADGHLADVREAEQDREGEARSSVIEALDQRAG